MGAPQLQATFPSFASARTCVAPASLFSGIRWTPNDPSGGQLVSGIDYILDCLTNNPNRGPATGGINIQHGRHKLIYGVHLSQSADGGPNLYIAGGDQACDICMEGVLMDAFAGGESDGIRSHQSPLAPDLTVLKMLNCRIEGIRGQSNPQGGGSTTLGAAMTSGATTMTIASVTNAPPAPFVCKIGNEVIGVGARSGPACSSLTRGMQDANNVATTAAAHSLGDAVAYTDDYGNPTVGTHADSVQLPGGLGGVRMESCTVGSRYSALQLQHEQTEQGSYKTITGATNSGPAGGRNRARYTFNAATPHGMSVGDWLQVGNGVAAGGSNLSPSGWNGTYHVVNVVSTTVLECDFGTITPPGSFTSGGTAKLSIFAYPIGDLWFNRVNVIAQTNPQQYWSQQPVEMINAIRFGGRPDAKAFADRTPLLVDGVGDGVAVQQRVVTFDEFYVEVIPAAYGGTEDLADIMNPGSGSTIYSEGRATITGTTPHRTVSYPNYPGVNPIVDLAGNAGVVLEGPPPGGDFCPRTRVGYGYPKVLAV